MSNKISRREMLRLMALTGSAAVLAACTAPKTETTAPSVEEPTKVPEVKQINISLLEANPEYTEWFDGYFVPAFQAEYPNIKVTHESVKTENLISVVTARQASGELDVYRIVKLIYSYPTIEELQAVCVNLKDEKWLSYFDPNTLKMEGSDKFGGQWAVPTGTVGTGVLYYNKTYTDSLGLSLPKTWGDFLTFLDAIKADGKMAPILYGGADKWPLNMIFISFVAAIIQAVKPTFFFDDLRAGTASLDDPLMLEVFTKFQKLGEYFQENALGEAYDNIPGMFAQEKGAMIIDGSWRAGPLDTTTKPEFEVGVMVPPFSDIAENNTLYTAKVAYSFGIYPSGDTARVEASSKLLEFFFRPANYQKWIDACGFTPVIPNITMNGKVAQAITQLANQSTTVTCYEQLSIPGAVWKQNDLCNQLLGGTITPEQAVSDLKLAFEDSKPDWK